MKKFFPAIFLLSFVFFAGNVIAQTLPVPPSRNPPPRGGNNRPVDVNAELDSLRKLEDEGRDTLIITSKYIRYTSLGLLQDSTQTVPLDTTFRNFHYYNPLNQPQNPTINLGNLGIAYREMLFKPSEIIGFDHGFHSLDVYRLTQDSIRYYRARSPFTSLSYINGSLKEQFFKATHSQNIKPNWNFGANYYRINSEGFYRNQTGNHLNASLFTWYESPNKRYNLLANGLFNTLRASENGSLINEDIFTEKQTGLVAAERVRLGNGVTRFDKNRSPYQEFKQKQYFIKQFYYIGRLDSMAANTNANILPTQRFSHAFTYTKDAFKFQKNELQDSAFRAFPEIPNDTLAFTKDSTTVTNIRNEFMYSFYLRGRSVSFLKNELKLDLGLQHDLYNYSQKSYSYDKPGYSTKFQNITLKANAGYQFSDRVSIVAQLQQIAQGRHAGDYHYDAETQILLSRSVGRIVLGAFMQNKSPQEIFERVDYTYHKWDENFDRTKTNNLSFAYINPKFGFSAKADYFLVKNHLYFRSTTDTLRIEPDQFDRNINLIKLTLSKSSRFGRFNLDNFVVYQKTDFTSILRTPEIYTYNSLYFGARIFKSITTNLGFDVRWNSPFPAPSYAINVSQFYNGDPVEFESYPILDVWAKFALKRANVFLRYDYINQGWLSKGYYTVNRYPMPDKLLKFGVTWNFYD